MPQQELAYLTQTAVLWNSTGIVDRFGQIEVGDPIEVPCRWNEGAGEALDAQGNTIALDASVVLDRRVLSGSQMWLGTLAAWNAGAKDLTPNYLMEVKTTKVTLDVKGRASFYGVGLVRFKDK